MISEGKLGDILSCTVTTRWWRDNDYFLDDWHGDPKRVGGMLFNQSPHILDLMLKVCGKVDKINGYAIKGRDNIEIDNVLIANVLFKNGIVGLIDVNTLSKDKNYENSIYVLGTKGCIKVGGPALNEIEYGYTDSNMAYPSINNEDIYGNGHNKLIKNISKLILDGIYDSHLVNAKEAKEVTGCICEIYKKIKYLN